MPIQIQLHCTLSLHFHSHRSPSSLFLPTTFTLSSNKHNPLQYQQRLRYEPIKASFSSSSSSSSPIEIDMVKNNQGIYAPKHNKVVVLWDLDNKPPRGPPFNAAFSLKRVASHFGEVVDISAYANRHAFIHLPQWVLQQRRERKNLDILERKGVVTPSEPYTCGVCGRKCKTNMDLKKHFQQLHVRERQKKLNRMRSLKGKKRQRFKERFISGNEKYNEAARDLVRPRVGYGLASELRRGGVFVETVEDKPQASDWALKRQMQHSMSRGIDWLVLVSDDSDFSEMLRRARDSNLGTVVVGDWDRALGRHADLWVPWVGVEIGEISERDLVPRRRKSGEFVEDDGMFSVSDFEGGNGVRDLDGIVDELISMRSGFGEEERVLEEEEQEGDYLFESSEDDYIEVFDNDYDDDGF